MIKISHRGNLFGKNISQENSPEYIVDAIRSGYDCEVDLWRLNGELFLGHDNPQYKVDNFFIDTYVKKLWIHCKNLEALDFVMDMPKYYRAFWHENDSYTITTNRYIWTYPGMPVSKQSILVHLDLPSKEVLSLNLAGICSDHIGRVNAKI